MRGEFMKQLIPDAGWVCRNPVHPVEITLNYNSEQQIVCPHCGESIYVYHEYSEVFTPAEIKERDKLQLENTSEKLRARVLAEQAKSNGR